jgi:uncharacterized protein (TIRG00374 family)
VPELQRTAPLAAARESRRDGAEIFSQVSSRRIVSAALIGVAAYGGLLLYADFGALVSSMGNLPGMAYLTALALSSGAFLLRFARWQIYLRMLSIKVGLRDSLLVFFSGFAMTITPGKMGEVLKSLMLKHARGVPVARSSPIVVAERITDLFGLLLLMGAGCLFLPNGVIISTLAAASVAAGTVVCLSDRFGSWCIGIVVRIPRAALYESKLRTAYGSLREVMTPKMLAAAQLLSLASWGLQCLTVSVFAANVPAMHLGLLGALIVFCAPLIAGAICFIPGGLGPTEASMTGAIRALSAGVATPAVAAAITIAVRLVSFWFAVVIGCVALTVWRLKRTPTAGSETKQLG